MSDKKSENLTEEQRDDVLVRGFVASIIGMRESDNYDNLSTEEKAVVELMLGSIAVR